MRRTDLSGIAALGALALVALSPSPGDREARAQPPDVPPEAVCWWRDARWEHYGVLRVPHSLREVAQVHPMKGVLLDGDLIDDPFLGPVFRVRLEGEGVRVEGDLDPREDWLFRVNQLTPLTGESALAEGAHVAVAAFSGEDVIVRPIGTESWFVQWTPLVASVPCARLNVLAPRKPWTKSQDEERLGDVGLMASDDPLLLDVAKSRILFTEPGEGVLGRFVGKQPQEVFPLEEGDGGWRRIAVSNWTGLVLVGWTHAPDAVTEVGKGGLAGVLGALAADVEIDVVQCGRPLPLYAGRGKRSWEIGAVAAGVPLATGEVRGNIVQVTLPGSWVSPLGKGWLGVPVEATNCPKGSWKLPGIGDLLEPLEAVPVETPAEDPPTGTEPTP